MHLPVWAVHFLVNTPYMSCVCGKRACWGCTLESTSSCTTVLVVSSTRTVCKSFSSSKPFSISCHSMLMMFPAAACHTHTNTHTHHDCPYGPLSNNSITLFKLHWNTELRHSQSHDSTKKCTETHTCGTSRCRLQTGIILRTARNNKPVLVEYFVTWCWK